MSKDLPPFRNSVAVSIRGYLDQYHHFYGAKTPYEGDLYEKALAEMEKAMLTALDARTNHNQSEMTRILGLNRGTLRKKLKEHGLLC